MMSITPYAYFMIKDVAPHLSDPEASRVLTLIFSTYMGAQFATNLAWGRISDIVGRKPPMLFGLAVICVSSLGFGFTTNVAGMFVFRAMAGLLVGNVVIVRTMIGDMIEGRREKARAFAWNQTMYQTGAILGPLVGGYLARPCYQYPQLCNGGGMSLLQGYPFALPNLVIAGLAAASFVTGYFFIEETLERPSYKRNSNTNEEDSVETEPLLPDQKMDPRPSLTSVSRPSVLHAVLSYGIMALHTICFDEMFPVFMATPPAEIKLPFRLAGGLGFDSGVIATFMSTTGILCITLMITIFPVFDALFGSLQCLQVSLFLYPITYFAVPYMAALPGSPSWIRYAAAAAVLLCKSLAAIFSFNEIAVLLTEAAPAKNTLGLVNGLSQTAAAGGRTLGPVLMGLFIGLGDHIDMGSLGWWFVAAASGLGAIQGLWVSDKPDTEGEEDDS